MNQRRQHKYYQRAKGIAVLDVLLAYFALAWHMPALQEAVGISLSQAVREAGFWSIVAEMLFYWGILIGLYGLISLWLPELRFILWAGAGLGLCAGSLYMLSGLMYYEHYGMGAPIQQGGFMFVLSLVITGMVIRVARRVNPQSRV